VTTRKPRQQQHGCHPVNTATTTTAFENMFFFLFESIFLKNHMFPNASVYHTQNMVEVRQRNLFENNLTFLAHNL
jgi:hypothetical protein